MVIMTRILVVTIVITLALAMVVIMTADTRICIMMTMVVALSSADFDSQDDQSYDTFI